MNARALEKILHIEDEPDIRAVVRVALESIGGFTVEVASSGKEALEKAPSFAPDLILLDVMMPEMDGPATLAQLRELPGLKETPVIFMTAKVMDAERASYLEMGAIDVIAKPFDPMTLADRIRAIWEAALGE